MSLANHLLETYEDRKLMHPPQSVQRLSTVQPNAGMQNSKAGPSTTHHGANAAHGQQHQAQMGGGMGMGGGGGMEGDGNGWANHGMPWWMAMPPHLRAPQQSLTPWSEERIAQMQVRLARKLGPEYVTQRPGPGGGPKLSYIEGWKVINLANEVFGFSGWSSSIVSLVTDFIDVNEQGRCSISVSAQVRITLRDGAFHEDIGSGQAENVRGKASALDKAKKEAVTDATKRALRNFGNVLGNCLYDKSFTANVSKMKVPPPKWNPEELERRPEFTPAGGIRPPVQAPAYSGPAPVVQHQQAPQQQQSAQPDRQRAGTPLRSMNDSAVDQSVNITMDENFDAEFLDDSFFDVDANGDISRIVENPGQSKSASTSAAVQVQQQPPAQPAYQHGHRPEPTTASGPSRSSTSGPSAFQSNSGPSGPSRPQTEMRPPQLPEDPLARSSGSSSTISESGFARRPVTGGIVPPERPISNNAGSSARAQAILAAARSSENAPPSVNKPPISAPYSHSTPAQTRQFPPPPRSESPRIPAGGVDAVAAKAASARNFRANAMRLDLDAALSTDGSPGDGGMLMSGFASARGIKRVISGGDSGPTSPSKIGEGGNQGQQQQVYRNGPRMALGEIEIPDSDYDDRVKRQRGM